MFEEYSIHNLFRNSLKQYNNHDPHLSYLRKLVHVHPMNWWQELDWSVPGIYILTGGRQIGKTTSTKLMIRHVLENSIFSPENVLYLPCDQIHDDGHLSRTIRLFLEEIEFPEQKFLLVIDEVTFVADWDRAVKALADEGWFRRGLCVLTGSDSVILREAAGRLPGRRGDADVTDFHLKPLSFKSFVELTAPYILDEENKAPVELAGCFDKYLKCGGYLKAINDLHSAGAISRATYMVFEQWLAGDFEKRGKNTETLLHVLKTFMETGVSQTTYSRLTQRMGLVSKETFIDYSRLLFRMDVLFELEAFNQNTQRGFPKKARKFHFADPFIMDTIARWLVRERMTEKRDTSSIKAESVAAGHMRRMAPTYYYKNRGEIDVIVIRDKAVFPLEVKWGRQLRPADAKSLKKFPNSRILAKQWPERIISGIPVTPLPLFLVAPLFQGMK